MPKRHPRLVLDVFKPNGTAFVELGYGTSALTTANRGYEVRVALLCRAKLEGTWDGTDAPLSTIAQVSSPFKRQKPPLAAVLCGCEARAST